MIEQETKKEIRTLTCPVCKHSGPMNTFLHNTKMSYVACMECGTLFMIKEVMFALKTIVDKRDSKKGS